MVVDFTDTNLVVQLEPEIPIKQIIMLCKQRLPDIPPMQSPLLKRRSFQQIRKSVQSTIKMPRKLSYCSSANQQSPEKQAPQPQEQDHHHAFASLFTLTDKIGQGAHGVVYRCRDNKTDQVFAVKVMAGDDELIRIAKRTYHILRLFDHESIAKGRKLFIDERRDQIYMVMEYCPYPSLKSLLRERSLTYEQSKLIIKNLLETVLEVNRLGVCHRDLKPDNILVNRETLGLKLIDFGVSKQMYNRKTSMCQKMWTVTGTIHYKAPEMFAGKAYDHKVDAWAIGVIAYELIYGKLPFSSEYTGELIDEILEQEPDYPELHEPRETTLSMVFIKALLKKDPSLRVNCEEALRHPWISPSKLKRIHSNENHSISMEIPITSDEQEYEDVFPLPISLAGKCEMETRTPNNYETRRTKPSWGGFRLEEEVHQIRRNINENEWAVKECPEKEPDTFKTRSRSKTEF